MSTVKRWLMPLFGLCMFILQFGYAMAGVTEDFASAKAKMDQARKTFTQEAMRDAWTAIQQFRTAALQRGQTPVIRARANILEAIWMERAELQHWPSASDPRMKQRCRDIENTAECYVRHVEFALENLDAAKHLVQQLTSDDAREVLFWVYRLKGVFLARYTEARKPDAYEAYCNLVHAAGGYTRSIPDYALEHVIAAAKALAQNPYPTICEEYSLTTPAAALQARSILNELVMRDKTRPNQKEIEDQLDSFYWDAVLYRQLQMGSVYEVADVMPSVHEYIRTAGCDTLPYTAEREERCINLHVAFAPVVLFSETIVFTAAQREYGWKNRTEALRWLQQRLSVPARYENNELARRVFLAIAYQQSGGSANRQAKELFLALQHQYPLSDPALRAMLDTMPVDSAYLALIAYLDCVLHPGEGVFRQQTNNLEFLLQQGAATEKWMRSLWWMSKVEATIRQ